VALIGVTSQEKTRTASWWLWPNVLSLDAPVVTLVWQWWFAKTFQIHLGAFQYLVLFLTVWLIYALDRWLDAWKLDVTKPHSSRHGFYLRYRWQTASIWWVVFLGTAVIALSTLPRHDLAFGGVLLLLCIFYFLLLQKGNRFIVPKEVQVGIIMSLGVTLCLWSWVMMLELFLPTFCFALLITFNCVLIAYWEKPFDVVQGYASIALTTSQAWLTPFMLTLVGLALTLSFWQVFYVPVLLSAAALLGLHVARDCFSLSLLRVLADAVLLGPLLFIWM
jgi:hypothetical protein